ncbi:MAG: FAD-binding oxidoreductase [Dehalococcoidales bacterium]
MASPGRISEVVVIGGGVVGISIAYHLAKRGCRDVVVVEKNYLGSGSTEKCPGGIRQQFAAEVNVRLSVESVRFFERFEEETGHAADFRQDGYLILATSQEDLAAFAESVPLQRRLGVDVESLPAEDVAAMVPGLECADILGATFCPTDGFADPYSVVSGFASAARRLGVTILEDTEATAIDLRAGKVDGVTTSRGRLATPLVVNAAGPWAAAVGRMAGVDIPVRPSRRHVFVTGPVFNRPGPFRRLRDRRLPMVIDFATGFWFRREGPSLIFGMRNPAEPAGFSLDIDWDFFTGELAPVACRRLPALRETGIARAQAGLHSDTPDRMAVLGEAPEVGGLHLACGFSGHGFMHAPAVGRVMADLILDGTVSPDVAALRPDRFRQGETSGEAAFI